MTVYTKFHDGLAAWVIDTNNHKEAIKLVKDELGPLHRKPILCLFTNTNL